MMWLGWGNRVCHLSSISRFISTVKWFLLKWEVALLSYKWGALVLIASKVGTNTNYVPIRHARTLVCIFFLMHFDCFGSCILLVSLHLVSTPLLFGHFSLILSVCHLGQKKTTKKKNCLSEASAGSSNIIFLLLLWWGWLWREMRLLSIYKHAKIQPPSNDSSTQPSPHTEHFPLFRLLLFYLSAVH